ncbi:protein FAM169B-like isoform X3 [Sceloporus undulatus]|uniref:protein FAM169B-like isoform X3 n=1 Tax=Sceloporus undulatus TaxID=8520 RepID=UPI001C4B315F|nr:protein FAM169B-like isoform X3 [Sceloporus undulatus]
MDAFPQASSLPSGLLYPVDMKEINPEVLERTSLVYHTKLLEELSLAPELFSVPGREKVQLEASLMHFLPLYREDSKCKILVLTDPQDKNAVLALYLHSSWWPIEDVVKTTDPFREGLIQVQTFTERIVLFVLNCIIFGMLERSLTHDILFVPHSKKERAKIFWTKGEAVAFYTIKAKGSLCDGLTSQCYLLPVLDTMFVRQKFRRCGLGLKMLHDFCQMFATEEALGLSCPVSADMYRVCQKFLEIHPEEQSRLWEVEAPGDWSQRVSIWLKIQLERNLPREVDSGSPGEKVEDDEPVQSDETHMNKMATFLKVRHHQVLIFRQRNVTVNQKMHSTFGLMMKNTLFNILLKHSKVRDQRKGQVVENHMKAPFLSISKDCLNFVMWQK